MSELRAEALGKRYHARSVVRDVSLQVHSGEVVGLLGPNGAGKTTCFYMMVGLVPCDQGAITIDGQEITREPMHLRAQRGIGYLPQEASVFRRLTAEENLLAILETRPELSPEQRRLRADELLHEFHIGHLKGSLGISLSGGERRRLEIARALTTDPRFILLDEPFAGVDPLSILDIQRIIAYLRTRGIGVLITDHNVRETLGICDRAYIMSDGQGIAEGTPAQILENQRVREVYLGHDFRL